MSKSRTSIISELTIARAFELTTGTPTASARRYGRHLRVTCPDRKHSDSHPSCDLDTSSNTWCCRSCAAGGGVLDLPIAAGLTVDRAHAARWYKQRLGVKQSSGITLLRSMGRKSTRKEIEGAIACEIECVLEREGAALSYRPPLLTRHVAEARRFVGRRLGITIAPPPPRWFEIEPHCSDPLWRMFVIRAIEERAWLCNVKPELMRRQAAAKPRVADAILIEAAHQLRCIGCAP